MIASGVSLQDERNKKLLTHIQRTFYACPSQGQFIEGGVKDTALVGQTGAEERRRNNMAIIRSHTVEKANEMAKNKQVHKKRMRDNVPDGSNLTTSFLDVVEKQFKHDTTEEALNKAKSLLARTHQFKNTRQEDKVKKILVAKEKTANKAQQKRGVNYPAAALGHVTYHSVYRTKYIVNVINELKVRQVSDNLDGVGIKDLLEILKRDEETRHGGKDKKGFRPLTDFSECLI